MLWAGFSHRTEGPENFYGGGLLEHEKKEREREDGGNWFARAIIALMGSALGTAVAIGVNRLLILMNLGNLDQLAIVPMILTSGPPH